jgi:hypothetical protein
MKQYEENGYLITEYDNGTVIKSLISNEEIIPPDEPIPTNPITELQKESAQLKINQELIQQALNELILGGI